MNRRRRQAASVYRRWHRFFAVAGALFIIFLVLTGMAINHGELLGLGRHSIEKSWLLGWYGLREPARLESVALKDRTLTWAGNRLYLDGMEIATTNGTPVGAVLTPDLIIVAQNRTLLLLTPGGDLVERLQVPQIEAGTIETIGLSRFGLVVLKSGSWLLQADQELLDWQPLPEAGRPVQWSVWVPTPKVIHEQVVRNHQGPGLSLEQLLLDLHSGRFFGSTGVIIYDLLALILLTLALSGLILWQRGRRNGRNNTR